MITGEMHLFAGVDRAIFQVLEQFRTLIEFIATEANHQVAFLDVVTSDQPQGFLGIRAELRFHAKSWCQFPQQRNRAVRLKVVETEGYEPSAAPATVGCQQVELAAKTVTHP